MERGVGPVGRRGFVVVGVLFGCAAALTGGVVLTMAYAPHHVQIAGDGPPTIFEEAVPGRHQRESVVWEGGGAAIASAGEVTTCSFAPVDGSAPQQVELHGVGRLRAPSAPWQWSGTPTVAPPAVLSCQGGGGSAAVYLGDQATRWHRLGGGNREVLLLLVPMAVAVATVALHIARQNLRPRRHERSRLRDDDVLIPPVDDRPRTVTSSHDNHLGDADGRHGSHVAETDGHDPLGQADDCRSSYVAGSGNDGTRLRDDDVPIPPDDDRPRAVTGGHDNALGQADERHGSYVAETDGRHGDGHVALGQADNHPGDADDCHGSYVAGSGNDAVAGAGDRAVAGGGMVEDADDRGEEAREGGDPAAAHRAGVLRGLAVVGGGVGAVALGLQLWAGATGVGAPSAIGVPAGEERNLQKGALLVTAEGLDVGDLTVCTARGAEGDERVLILHRHRGPWTGSDLAAPETSLHRPSAGQEWWIGTPAVTRPATLTCSHEVELFGGDEIATWFRYDENAPRLVMAIVVPLAWLLFTAVAWTAAGTRRP